MKKNLIGSDELKQFYREKFYFSYSSINKLLFSPSMFFNHYVLKQKEDSVDPHLVKGRVIHCLLLNPEDYNNEFITVPGRLPSGNNRMIVDEIFKLHLETSDDSLTLLKYETAIVDLLKKINLHQKLKTDEARTKKILIADNISYFEFLKSSQGKTLLDYETLNYCKECVESIKENESVKALLQLDDSDLKVYNEISAKTDKLLYGKFAFGFKGILDNIVIDDEKKILFINDLKTTGKPLIDFPESVEYYRYWIQAALYYNLAFYTYIVDKDDAKDWNIQFTFIVVDKYNQVYPFQVTPKTMSEWMKRFYEKVLKQVVYHYEKKDYNLPYELAVENLKL
jgi:hypoxanthine phosphoribosyltransferase